MWIVLIGCGAKGLGGLFVLAFFDFFPRVPSSVCPMPKLEGAAEVYPATAVGFPPRETYSIPSKTIFHRESSGTSEGGFSTVFLLSSFDGKPERKIDCMISSDLYQPLRCLQIKGFRSAS